MAMAGSSWRLSVCSKAPKEQGQQKHKHKQNHKYSSNLEFWVPLLQRGTPAPLCLDKSFEGPPGWGTPDDTIQGEFHKMEIFTRHEGLSRNNTSEGVEGWSRAVWAERQGCRKGTRKMWSHAGRADSWRPARGEGSAEGALTSGWQRQKPTAVWAPCFWSI